MHETVVPFRAGDGFDLNLVRVGGDKPATRGPVLLVHGAGVRANIFRAPVRQNIVDRLVAEGYDVWLENWRASIEFRPNTWNLDEAAMHDHPAAVRTIVEQTGSDKLKAIIHCQGSTSFTMSVIAGLVPQVTTVVSNAVSLCPVIPGFSRAKLTVSLPLLHLVMDYLNPQWGLKADRLTEKLLRAVVLLIHHECSNPVCKMVSFTYGAGFPALWRHENLNEDTHQWLNAEFANVPMTFFAQILRCVQAGRLLSYGKYKELPLDFAAREPQSNARFAFFAGELNRCFLADSQRRAFAKFDAWRPRYHTLHTLDAYSHLDVFMGQNAAQDVFPLMLAELEKPN